MLKRMKLIVLASTLLLCLIIPGITHPMDFPWNSTDLTSSTISISGVTGSPTWAVTTGASKFNSGEDGIKAEFGGVIGPDAGALLASAADLQTFSGAKVMFDVNDNNAVVLLNDGTRARLLVDGQPVSKNCYVVSAKFRYYLGYVSADLTRKGFSVSTILGDLFLVFLKHIDALAWVPQESATADVASTLFHFDFEYGDIAQQAAARTGESVGYYNFDTPRVDAVLTKSGHDGSLKINLSPQIRFNGYQKDNQGQGKYRYIKNRMLLSDAVMALMRQEHAASVRVYAELNSCVAFFRFISGGRAVDDFASANIPKLEASYDQAVSCDFAKFDRSLLRPFLLHPKYEKMLAASGKLDAAAGLINQYLRNNRSSKDLQAIAGLLLQEKKYAAAVKNTICQKLAFMLKQENPKISKSEIDIKVAEFKKVLETAQGVKQLTENLFNAEK
jgi:hypothetical protein